MLIFTGRFQPFHNGHMDAINTIAKNYPTQKIMIAIIKDYAEFEPISEFHLQIKRKISETKLFFNTHIVLKMIKNYLDKQPKLKRRILTTVIPVPNKDNFETIKHLLDFERSWIFTQTGEETNDNWERQKKLFYESLGEKCEFININSSAPHATTIRDLICAQRYDSLSNYIIPENIEIIKNIQDENAKEVCCFGGRFQPFHLGHILMIKNIKKNNPNNDINICIIKDINSNEQTKFSEETRKRLVKSNAPYNAEETLTMINNCVANQPKTFENVTFTLIPYPNYEDFNLIKSLLDFKRKWEFTRYLNMSDEWEEEKSRFFKDQKENYEFVLVKKKDISGTEIRSAIKNINKEAINKMLPRGTLSVLNKKESS